MILAEFRNNLQRIYIKNITKSSDRVLLRHMCTGEEVRFVGKTMRKTYHKMIRFDGKTAAYIPAGLYKKLNDTFRGNIKWMNLGSFFNKSYIDKQRLDRFISDPTFSNYEARTHQTSALYKTILQRMSRSYVDVSGGKTFIAYMICRYSIMNILSNGEKVLIVVPKPDLVTQYVSDVEEYQVADQPESNKVCIQPVFSGLKYDVTPYGKAEEKHLVEKANVVVGNRQTLCKYKKSYFDQFSVVIFDEAHTLRISADKKRDRDGNLKNGQVEQIYQNLNPARIKVITGLSGTMPEELDNIQNGKFQSKDALVLESLLGPIAIKKTLTELVSEGYSSDFEIKQIIINIDDSDFANSFYTDSDIIDVRKRRYREMELLYETRIQEKILVKLLKRDKNKEKNHMLLFNTLTYLNDMHEYLSSNTDITDAYNIHVISGAVKKSDRESIKQELSDSAGNILLATYGTMDTGTSIKRLHNYYIVDSCKVFYRVRQSIGRMVRKHETKDKALIYDFAYKVSSPIKDMGMQTNIIYRQALSRRKIYGFNKYKLSIHNVNSSNL